MPGRISASYCRRPGTSMTPSPRCGARWKPSPTMPNWSRCCVDVPRQGGPRRSHSLMEQLVAREPDSDKYQFTLGARTTRPRTRSAAWSTCGAPSNSIAQRRGTQLPRLHLRRNGDELDEAEQLIRRALAWILTTVLRRQSRLGLLPARRVRQAVEYLQRALELVRDDPTVAEHLGDATARPVRRGRPCACTKTPSATPRKRSRSTACGARSRRSKGIATSRRIPDMWRRRRGTAGCVVLLAAASLYGCAAVAPPSPQRPPAHAAVGGGARRRAGNTPQRPAGLRAVARLRYTDGADTASAARRSSSSAPTACGSSAVDARCPVFLLVTDHGQLTAYVRDEHTVYPVPPRPEPGALRRIGCPSDGWSTCCSLPRRRRRRDPPM